MAQTNYTPISLYYSTTASAVPTAANLVQGELAINTNDGKLYYEDSSGVVQVLATKSTGSIGGSNTQVQFNNSGSLGGSSGLTWDGSFLTTSSIKNSALTSGRVTYAGASGLLSDSAGLTFDGTNLTTTGTATATRFIPSGSTVATNGMYLPSANTLGFSTNSTIRATLDAAGNLGLGITAASWNQNHAMDFGYNGVSYTGIGNRASINSTILAHNLYINSSDSFIYKNTAAASLYQMYGGSHNFFRAISGTGETSADANLTPSMIIDSSGVVTMAAYGAGAATFSASGVISSVSDETWKIKDGVPNNPDVMLQKLNPGYWFYNDEKKDIFGKERQLGFYAQNVHEAIGEEAAPIPEKFKDIDGNETSVTKPWGYYDRSVLAITVMSLKNALSTIEELKQRIAKLESN